MPFPFTFKFSSKPNVFFGTEDYQIVFDYLSNYLLKKQAKDIIINDNVLVFKVIFNTSNFNWTLPIDSGEITIIKNDGYVILTYKIFFYINFLIYFAIASGVGISSKSIFLGFLVFLVIYCHNLLITFFKHKNRLNKITAGIESLIKQKNI